MENEIQLQHAFKEIKDIGVIWVIDEATKLGYYNGNPEWANLGQGEPEVGEIDGAPPRIKNFAIEPGDDRYGPLNGLTELRQAIANHYNRLYRPNKSSQYKAENVSIAMGGRLALTRIFSILGSIKLGYKTPEYPAYEDMINYQQGRVSPICIPTSAKYNHSIPSKEFEETVKQFRLDAFLFSNPCNPTGHVVQGAELSNYIRISNEQNCSLIIDEFYSHFIYNHGKPAEKPISSAEFIEDVNADSVLIVDGLTKSFRYPGWRLAWVLGPENVIEDLGRVASGIDGGPSLPIQRAALQLFEPERADKETQALRNVFSKKQNMMLKSLRGNGIICSDDSHSTFYVWGDISHLPSPINNADTFFAEALKRKVLTVPGYMFDINPGSKRHDTQFNQHIRFSFGPEEDNLKMGLKQITELIQSFK